MAVLEHEGLTVQYDVEGEGPAVLFMHGLAADRQQARNTFGVQTGICLITLDMPGHGETILSADKPLESQVGFNQYAKIALALLDHLGVRSVMAGGISMGAGIALTLGMLRPNLLNNLFLVRPAWLAKPAHPHLDLVATLGALSTRHTPDEVASLVSASDSFKERLADIPAAAESLLQAAYRPQARKAAAVLPHMVNDQPVSRLTALSRLHCPALVLGSNADPLHPVLLARELASALPQGRYVQLPPRYLDPAAHQAALNNSFRSFLERVPITHAMKVIHR
jgi:pimeloyl-ACP methyl ester carboxylesterase